MVQKKKKWEKPKLIVIGRGTTEESVLGHCKGSTIQGNSGPTLSCVLSTGTKCNNKTDS
jgi:hypothetical protein